MKEGHQKVPLRSNVYQTTVIVAVTIATSALMLAYVSVRVVPAPVSVPPEADHDNPASSSAPQSAVMQAVLATESTER